MAAGAVGTTEGRELKIVDVIRVFEEVFHLKINALYTKRGKAVHEIVIGGRQLTCRRSGTVCIRGEQIKKRAGLYAAGLQRNG